MLCVSCRLHLLVLYRVYVFVATTTMSKSAPIYIYYFVLGCPIKREVAVAFGRRRARIMTPAQPGFNINGYAHCDTQKPGRQTPGISLRTGIVGVRGQGFNDHDTACVVVGNRPPPLSPLCPLLVPPVSPVSTSRMPTLLKPTDRATRT